jgi:hypothetical protein
MPVNASLEGSARPQLPFFVSDHGQDSLFSVTIASSSTVLSGGQVLGKITASGKYTAYNNGNSDGTEVARGILFERVDASDGDHLGSMMVHGVVRSGSLIGIDSAGITDLTDYFNFV